MGTEANMRPSFMLDHMVIKLGKYLRILGYDAVWDAANRTHDLIMAANRDGRWFLTRNTRLSNEYPRAEHLVTLASDDPVEQLGELHAALPLDFTSRLFTRCIRCNIELEFIPHKEDARRFVHPNVWQKHDSFFRCPGCGTVFWKGSHVRNTCRKLGLDAGPV